MLLTKVCGLTFMLPRCSCSSLHSLQAMPGIMVNVNLYVQCSGQAFHLKTSWSYHLSYQKGDPSNQTISIQNLDRRNSTVYCSGLSSPVINVDLSREVQFSSVQFYFTLFQSYSTNLR